MDSFYRRPAALGAATFFLCATVLSYSDRGMHLVLLALSVLILGTAVFFCKRRKTSLNSKDQRIAVISVSVALVFASVFSVLAFDVPQPEKLNPSGGIVQMRGTVYEKLWSTGSFSSYKLHITEIAGEKASVTVLAEATDASLEAGDLILAEGELLSLEEAEMTDLERYLRSEGIVCYTELEGIVIEDEIISLAVGIGKLRGMLSGRMLTFIDGEAGALVNSLVIGDRSGLSGGTRLDFERLGISHLLAISGIHMSVIFASLSTLLTFTPIGKRRGAIVLIPFILLYMGLSGFSASVVRAGTMLIGGCVLSTVGRRRDPFSFLGVCVVAIAVIDPNVFFDTGFLLSVLSVAGVMWFGELTAGRDKKDRPFRIRVLFSLLSASAVTIVVSIFTLPVIALEFGSLSIVSPLANIIFIPLVTGLLYVIPVFILTLPFPPSAVLMGQVVGAYASLILELADRMASVDSLTVSVKYPFFTVLSIIAVVGMFLLLIRGRRRVGAVILSVSCTVALLSAGICELSRRDTVSLTAISGKSGDIICVTEGSQCMLIDMTSGTASTMLEGLEYAESVYITEIDHYVLTHYHSRHVTMIQTLLSETYVGTLWLPEPIGKEELEISADIAAAAYAMGTQVCLIDGNVTLGEVVYTPGERCWLSRSVESVHSLKISAYGNTAMYLSAGYYDVSEDFRALSGISEANVLIYGSHGARSVENIVPPKEAYTLVFLGESENSFPAENAVKLHDNGCVLAESGYTVKWHSGDK